MGTLDCFFRRDSLDKKPNPPSPSARVPENTFTIPSIADTLVLASMSDFPDLSYSYLYSDPPDPNEQLPPLFFNSLPYRKSRFHETATSTSLDVIKRVAQNSSKSPETLFSRGCITSTGHLISLGAPELPPALIPLMAEMCELVLHYDGNQASLYY